MIRISTIFIAICMVLVAASLGLALHAVAGFSGTESAIVALTALTFLILYNAWGILRDAVDILLEATPRNVNMKKMVEDISQVDGVLGIHDIHVWSLTQSMRTMSAHILTDDVHISAGTQIQREISDILHHRYNISHATLQLECVDCFPDSLYCDLNGQFHMDDARHSSR